MKHEFEVKLKFNFVVDENKFDVGQFDDIGCPSVEMCEAALRQLLYMCNAKEIGKKIQYEIKPNSRFSVKDKTLYKEVGIVK